MNLLLRLYMLAWFATFPVYWLLQLAALFVLRGPMRWCALLPLLPMCAVAVHTVWAHSVDSNLWPIYMLFTSPPAATYIAVLLLLHRYDQKRNRPDARASA
jgi:hypothetical protein